MEGPVSQYRAARELTRRREARQSLLSFSRYTHPRWVDGHHQEEVCAALERVERGECRRLMLTLPPRHAKTELAVRRFVPYCLGRVPDREIIIASHTAKLAEDNSVDARKIVCSDEYRLLFPATTTDPEAAAASRWRTGQGGMVVAVGVAGAISGRGAHILIIDDPVASRADAESPRMRHVAWHWYTGDAMDRLAPDGAIVFMMTRWHEDDLAGRALPTENWEVVHMPAISEEDALQEQALWPERYPLEEMREKRAVLARAGRSREWQAKYQGCPRPEEGDFIKRVWFLERWNKGNLPKNLNVYMASDFAVTIPTEGADPDYTEHGVFGLCPEGRVYVLDWWSGRVTSNVWIESKLDLEERWKPLASFGETGQIRRAVEPWLGKRREERKVYARDEWLLQPHDKAVRGCSFQAMSACGRIVFPEPALAVWAEEVITQCCQFGSGHDDKFDVMAHMCAAIDTAHEAVVPRNTDKKPESRYKRASARGQGAQRVV